MLPTQRAFNARSASATARRVPHAAAPEINAPLPNASATINAQVWLSQFPLRPTAAWAVVAALLTAGWPGALVATDWRVVALLLLLVDPLWGSLWRLASGRRALLPLTQQMVGGRFWLPYLQPGSPAANFLGGNIGDVSPVLFRVALPSVVLALAVASVLSVQAVALTSAVVLISALGWLGSRYLGAPPAALHALVTVALPWWLALGLVAPGWSASGGAAMVALIGLWTLHNWGEGRLLHNGELADEIFGWQRWLGVGLVALADGGLIVLLLVSRSPLWLALFAVVALPTWLAVFLDRPTARLNVWWLAAMLASALGVAQWVG